MRIRYAVIADIVGSRDLPDRDRAQQIFLDVLARAGEGLDLLRGPYATVGDEFQAVAHDLGTALTLTLRAQLLLPDALSLRFGVGAGEIREVGAGAAAVQDGSAWARTRSTARRGARMTSGGSMNRSPTRCSRSGIRRFSGCATDRAD